MKFSNFSALFQFFSMHFANMSYTNLTENNGTNQNYFKQLHSIFENMNPLLIIIAITIDGSIIYYIWIYIRDDFKENQKTKKELFASFLKVGTSFVTTFLMPLLAQLKVEAIFAFLISVAKIALEFFEKFLIDKNYPEPSTEEKYEPLLQDEDYYSVMIESESSINSLV